MNEAVNERDIIALDLESTGVVISESYIIQIAIKRLARDADGALIVKSEWQSYIKPPVPISEKITEITGITDEHVKDAPIFAQIARVLVEKLRGCDIMSYNAMMLDMPLLAEECDRCGVAFLKINEFRLIDPYNIFCTEEPRSLTAALKFYCGKEIENAHDAMGDVNAMIAVFEAQTKRYPNLPSEPAELDKYCRRNRSEGQNWADYGRRFYFDETGAMYWAFGKWKDRCVDFDFGYVEWFLMNDFPESSKTVLRDYLSEKGHGYAMKEVEDEEDDDDDNIFKL